MTPLLYHFSEEPGIAVFAPRTLPARPELTAPLVWAIEASHQQMYLFPRDCPRALLWPVATTTDEDRAAWFAHVEYAWLERIRTTTLYRYTLPAATFHDLDDAGMWVSRETVAPERVEVVDDLLGALRDDGVELRVLDRLTPLRGVWERTTLHWSGIRLRNAQDWDVPTAPPSERLRALGQA